MLKKTIKRSVNNLLECAFGKINCQRLYERLYCTLLDVMNFGGGSYPQDSGERQALIFLKNKFKNDAINIFDVGANVGKYALTVLDEFKGRDIQVFCFEPSQNAYAELEENLAKRRGVALYNFGLGEKTEVLTMYTDKKCSPQASLYKLRLGHLNIDMKNEEKVRIKTIDEFCKENLIERIHFLKLDVEGHELKVIDGAKNMLGAGAINYIQFEFGACNIGSKASFQDLYYKLDPKYKIYRILRNGFFPIDRYKDIYEVYLTTNYLAEKR